jgi:copper chaperone CopZ
MVFIQSNVKYHIEGMDCADCALTLERSVAQVQGVKTVYVNFKIGRAHV